MADRVPTAAWRISAQVVLALEEHLGEPVDSYVNGSQTWLEDHGPGGTTLEWRLHPVAGFRLPTGLSHYELWESVTAALSAGVDPDAIALGDEERPLRGVWDGLECFPAHGDPLEPGELRGRVAGILGIEPDAAGYVDHEAIGAAWEQARGEFSIIDALFDQLRP